MKRYNVLVTGCGADVGQSMGKVLKSHDLFGKIFGTDVHDEHPAHFIYDECFVIDSCDSPDYLPQLTKILRDYHIDILIPSSATEMLFFFRKNILKNLEGTPVIMANRSAMECGFDKMNTVQFLRTHGLPYPRTQIFRDVARPQAPYVIKSRVGSGGKTVLVIREDRQSGLYQQLFPDYLHQEYLFPDDEEYTCTLFRGEITSLRSIVFKRQLRWGYSAFGIVTSHPPIDDLLHNISEGLNFTGSINVQLRLTERGPCVFEINPRFSSTVRFRDLLGFHDVLWSVQEALGLPIGEYSPPQSGMKFYKGFQEFIA